MEREHTRVHEEDKTEAGKVWWVRWVRWVWWDEDGDGRTKMGTNPDITPPSKVQCPDALAVKGEVLVGECGGTRQLTA